MTDDQLNRALRSVGMTTFIENLNLFASSLSNRDAATALHQRHGWSIAACATRVSNARRILENGRRREALQLIAQSKLPEPIRAAARAAQ